MGKISLMFFPWQRAFKKLELQRHWWHRLALVLFTIALILLFPLAWFFAFEAFEPPSEMTYIRLWTVDKNGNIHDLTDPPASAGQSDVDQSRPPDASEFLPVHALVEMPNRESKEFVGKSRSDILIEWNRSMPNAVIGQWVSSIVCSLAAVLFTSYLLQALYRTLLFVIYGSAQKPSSVP
jgi:hypothetical protein